MLLMNLQEGSHGTPPYRLTKDMVLKSFEVGRSRDVVCFYLQLKLTAHISGHSL